MKRGGLFLAFVAGCSGETLRDGICTATARPTAMARTCGQYRYTFYAYAYGAETKYFDDSGAIVAMQSEGDLEFTCDGGAAFAEHYGPELDCQKTPTEIICPGI